MNLEPLPPLANAFLHGTIDNTTFHHRDHLAVAFEILKRHAFPDGASIYCAALKSIAERSGNPRAFHVTITFAFLSLVAERSARANYTDFDAFAEDNPDLFLKTAVELRYSRERLRSDVARTTFLLPDFNR